MRLFTIIRIIGLARLIRQCSRVVLRGIVFFETIEAMEAEKKLCEEWSGGKKVLFFLPLTHPCSQDPALEDSSPLVFLKKLKKGLNIKLLHREILHLS